MWYITSVETDKVHYFLVHKLHLKTHEVIVFGPMEYEDARKKMRLLVKV